MGALKVRRKLVGADSEWQSHHFLLLNSQQLNSKTGTSGSFKVMLHKSLIITILSLLLLIVDVIVVVVDVVANFKWSICLIVINNVI